MRQRTGGSGAALSMPTLASFSIFFLLLGLCALGYYFGELVNLAGWDALRWDVFYGVHDVQRLFFLAPIIYAGYVFGTRAAVIATILAASIMVFRALCLSPFAGALARPAVFVAVAGAMGLLASRAHSEREKRQLVKSLRVAQRDRMLISLLEALGEGALMTEPDCQVRFIGPNLLREFGEGISSNCRSFMHRPQGTRPGNGEPIDTTDDAIERWEYDSPNGRTYEVLVAPYVAADGAPCRLAVFKQPNPIHSAGGARLGQCSSDALPCRTGPDDSACS